MNKLTPRDPTPDLAKLILDYGQACFECGAYDGNVGYEYQFLSDARALAHRLLVAKIGAMHDAAPSGWQPIETAPKDGYFLAANKHGVWVAHWQPQAVSGFRFDQPWRSVMLNHWHIEPKSAQYEKPTHWMPLPAPPSEKGE